MLLDGWAPPADSCCCNRSPIIRARTRTATELVLQLPTRARRSALRREGDLVAEASCPATSRNASTKLSVASLDLGVVRVGLVYSCASLADVTGRAGARTILRYLAQVWNLLARRRRTGREEPSAAVVAWSNRPSMANKPLRCGKP
jgi:hypothetical protein